MKKLLKKIRNFFAPILTVIVFIILMLLPYCISFKIVEWIEYKVDK